ncbi:uncharacterized protein B0T15DRAFT_540900 [Chaetomium strumarium]|uniref:Clr5 domain-containing protein n=1 Tax=Chaetomium strumarium TaxID=1170767 RepID=A0AAJ0GPB7_9PEZI|nr:hypothetical protein B0T15DRAFT_540900 [Chaetomium strumarium]
MENAITVPLHSDQYAMFSSPNWFAENAGGASIPVTQRETVARWQCDNVDDSAVVLVTNTSSVSHVPSVGKPDDGNARHRVVRKRIRHSASEWKEMDSHLRRLYLIHGHTAEEVAFEMFAIHDFEASVGTYQKRLASLGKDKRLRTARALPDDPSLDTKTETPKLFEIVAERVRRTRAEEQRSERNRRKEERNRRRQLQVERGNKKGRKKRKAKPAAGISQGAIGPFLHTIYIHQEELFHAIDAFCKVLFAAGNKSWAADARHFRPPPNTPDSSRAWQLLSDQVAGVQMLVEGQLYHHANYMLRQVLAGLRLAARVPDPSFLLHFWTMCDVFSNIPIRTKGKGQALPWLGWFLRHLKQILASEFGRRPLTVIVDSLLRVWASSPRDLKATLGLGHWKATHTMGDLIGNTHNIVLNMGICCSKTWKSKFSASSTTVKLLHRPLLVAVESPNHEPEHLAEASLNYLRAVTRDPCNEPEVISEASRLLSWTTDMCREKARRQALQYDSVTRAFVAATELVARHYLETRIPRPDPECGYKYMGEAVEILRCGDLQCRIRAASFSKRLQTWIKGHRRKKGERSKREAMEEEKMRVAQERVRTREIIRDITKERIKGSRRGKWVRRARVKRALKEGRPLEKNLLLASLEQTS